MPRSLTIFFLFDPLLAHRAYFKRYCNIVFRFSLLRRFLPIYAICFKYPIHENRSWHIMSLTISNFSLNIIISKRQSIFCQNLLVILTDRKLVNDYSVFCWIEYESLGHKKRNWRLPTAEHGWCMLVFLDISECSSTICCIFSRKTGRHCTNTMEFW